MVDLNCAFSALTGGSITQYFYGSHFDYLGNDGFKFGLKESVDGCIGYYHITRFTPTLAKAMNTRPIPIIRELVPSAAGLLNSQGAIRDLISRQLAGQKLGRKISSVIVSSLNDSGVPPEEKTLGRMQDEGVSVLFAGMETTARALSVAFYHLLHKPELMRRLREELQTLPEVEDDSWSVSQVENRPFLVSYLSLVFDISSFLSDENKQRGVFNEGLRQSHGSLNRMPRIATQDALIYNNYTIPPGVSPFPYISHSPH